MNIERSEHQQPPRRLENARMTDQEIQDAGSKTTKEGRHPRFAKWKGS